MATNCEKFTASAQAIFDEIKNYFPPDPWNNPQWTEEGVVRDNGVYDLRTSNGRGLLIEKLKNLIGYCVYNQASAYRGKKGSLRGFTRQHFSRLVQRKLELLLLLEDLDFQIETMDFIDS